MIADRKTCLVRGDRLFIRYIPCESKHSKGLRSGDRELDLRPGVRVISGDGRGARIKRGERERERDGKCSVEEGEARLRGAISPRAVEN